MKTLLLSHFFIPRSIIIFSMLLLSLSACSTAPQQKRAQMASAFPSTNNQLSPARKAMVDIAKSTLGIPYKWGGNTPREGFDCSGLTRYVHKNALGMTIPRITAQQRDSSRTINYAQLQPGDMLFFKTTATTNHVGIYIGNRKFIHAPAGGKTVKIATMDSPYWYKRFVKFGTFM